MTIAFMGGAFYRPGPKSRQRHEPELDHRAGARRDGRRGAAPHARHPDDVAARIDERQAVAIPAWHLRVDQKGLQPAIATPERSEPIATPARAHDEPRRQARRIEGHAL